MNLINTEQCVDDTHVIFHCGCELGEVLEELLISGNRRHFPGGGAAVWIRSGSSRSLRGEGEADRPEITRHRHPLPRSAARCSPATMTTEEVQSMWRYPSRYAV